MAVYSIHDDNKLLKKICDLIGGTAGRVVVESELKVVMGFKETKGHREWRKLKVRKGFL